MNNISFSHADLSASVSHKPLVLNITNDVSANWVANVLLAIGASPIMSNAVEEMKDLCQQAHSLVLNIGTIQEAQKQCMLVAAQHMLSLGKPIILDPVGVGASRYRYEVAQQLITQCHPAVIRGNASEIMSLAGHSLSLGGVDSYIDSDHAVPVAEQLAQQIGCVIAMSGEKDYVTNGQHTQTIQGGSPMQTIITGMGCATTAIVGAMLGMGKKPYEAAVEGLTLSKQAGEQAASASAGPGSMMSRFIDELYHLSAV